MSNFDSAISIIAIIGIIGIILNVVFGTGDE